MSGQPFQTHGFQTSVDLARRQTYTNSTAGTTDNTTTASITTVTPLAGVKRPWGSNNNSNDHHANPSTVDPPVFTDRTISHQNPNHVQFVRASASTRRNRIAASAIRGASGTVTADQLPSEYSQRTALPSTPAPSQNALLSLRCPRYGLPAALVTNFEALGVNSIYPWQASCLLGRGHLSGEKNLIYTAPTGGGKSLVADVLMLKKIIENPSRKAILVLPYVALVQEKLRWLRRLVEGVSKNVAEDDDGDAEMTTGRRPWKQQQKAIRVTGFFGGSKTRATWSDTDIAVCTIEKANSLVNTAIEECKVDDLAVVVLDEIHMLDDESRGYLMELMITKLLLLQQDIQIIGMSATLSNTELLAEWLRANFYISKYRPIPIEEYLVFENAIYPAASAKEFFQTAIQLNTTASPTAVEPCRTIDRSSFRELANPMANAMVALAVETATAGYGALVFCGSRHACQVNAVLISEAMPEPASLDPDVLDGRLDLLADLQSLPSGLDPVFQTTIVKGVAFHHAGLTTEERELVARAYDQGILRVLVATCSLAAGVNLPARRVIMHGARMGRDLVGPAMLRQMRGRAGRKGKDEVGETYLICQKADLEAVAELLDAETPAIASGLAPEKRGVKRALLEAIATRLVSGRDAIKEYVECTLIYRTADNKDIYKMMDATLRELVDEDLLRLRDDDSYEPTELGQAIVASAFSPEDGMFVYEELKRALQAFVMDGDMHVFYMFTPLQVALTTEIDWPTFRDQLENLDDSGLRALQFVGVQPGFVNAMVQAGSSLKENRPAQVKQARIYRRAYTAFQLRDLSNEVPLSTIARRYHTPRGAVQNLAQTCHGFAAGLVKFCQRMGWGMLAVVLDHMRDRLEAGARADLLEMAQVAYVKSWTARVLRENGFRSVRELAEAEPKDLVPVLMMANPRKAQKHQQYPKEAERYAAKLLAKAEIIVASANKLWERQTQVDIDE
ncbi:DNA-directed DNA polymerase theta, putative [Paecilomyces variotii No. 5]|uniref:DNA-directed DNA polymerase theta, putative n=1 Tax=Byssochlamys spectabilis (strain No. 5 / NBRC 109023) TaxID=1356009 RepID=V5FV99_BYSSN|nr:DNA-directed DNA polymerase theta, putative [Paecilomyces variotii No. 5]